MDTGSLLAAFRYWSLSRKAAWDGAAEWTRTTDLL